MELDPIQLGILGIAASIISALLRFLAAQFDIKPESKYIKLLVFVVALALTVVWARPSVELSEDPWRFAMNLLAAAIAVMGAARASYEVLLGRLGLSKLA